MKFFGWARLKASKRFVPMVRIDGTYVVAKKYGKNIYHRRYVN